MIEYIIAHSPDDRIIAKAIAALNDGKLICFPTDTNWIIAGNLHKKKAVEKLYQIKNEGTQKHFSLLCPNISKASEYAKINDNSFRLLKKISPGHYTFIFDATKYATKALKASKSDHEVGIRLVPSILVNKILEIFDDCIISTNITHQLLGIEESEDIYSYMIEDTLSHHLEMIIDPGELDFVGSSSIISLLEDNIEVVRVGAGDVSFLG